MDLVPPCRGQRVKSLILPPFIGGNAFQPVAYKAHADGDVVYGIIQRRCKTQSHVWLGYDLKPTLCNNDALTLIALPAVPKHAYSETTATIGGVGRHLRWNIVFPCHRMKNVVSVDVGNIGDIDAFKMFANDILRPFGLCRKEFTELNGIFSTVVDIPDASNEAGHGAKGQARRSARRSARRPGLSGVARWRAAVTLVGLRSRPRDGPPRVVGEGSRGVWGELKGEQKKGVRSLSNSSKFHQTLYATKWRSGRWDDRA